MKLPDARSRNLILLIALLIAALGWWRHQVNTDHHTYASADVLLEQYRNVFKLVTVEGQFQEIYSFKDYWGYDIAPLRKKALVRATGKVLVGYDLDPSMITMREEDRTIILEGLPRPEILALDLDLDYYDLNAGTFNPFGPEDLTRINVDIKENMRKKARQSALFQRADEQATVFYQTLRGLAQQAGWQVRYRENLHLYPLP